MAVTFFIEAGDWTRLLAQRAAGQEIFVARPAAPEAGPPFRYARWRPGEAFACLPCPPAVEPLKTFFFLPREQVAEYPGSPAEPPPEPPARLIAGVKACDLKALACLDAVFLREPYLDPFYAARRQRTLLVASDCAAPDEFCFCNLLGFEPFPGPGADLGLAPVEGGYLAEALTEAGQALLAESPRPPPAAAPEQLARREEARAAVREALARGNAPWRTAGPRRELLNGRLASAGWARSVATCVECAACLFTCPTCHCFLLADEARPDGFARQRYWDACIYPGYGRMAGGGTPRPRLLERFRHRFLHKFSSFPDKFGMEACSGCGRCRRCCPGEIDLRRVLKTIEECAPPG